MAGQAEVASSSSTWLRKQYGLLGDASPADPAADESNGTPLDVRRSWARVIRQVYEVNPLLCSQCGGRMKVIAVIERPAVVRQILGHLGFSTAAPSLRTPPDQPDGLAVDQPREWSYEPLFDDLAIPDPVIV